MTVTKRNVVDGEAEVEMAVAAKKPLVGPGMKYLSLTQAQILKDFDMNGSNRISSWVDSMRASSPTHLKSPPHFEKKASALDMFEEITRVSKGKQIVVFLDYDGTLSPIVDDPDTAFMSNPMRNIVREVAGHFPTAIVTGRCRDKVYSFVRLAELFYAGSHG